MNLNIIPLKESDYDNILCGWWTDWRWTPPSRDFLPDNGKGGFIVYDGDIPVCAGFMYDTNSLDKFSVKENAMEGLQTPK